ncbi:hypothetical protein ES703_113798 [subsurface metagenome]
MDMNLGKLEKGDPREYWKDEARDFTPWLAQEDNLDLLGDTISLQIELENTEILVGKYRADIIAGDVNSERIIIIENQLEKTNHDHLGKIITYASGIGAEIVIWICSLVTDEHRNVIDWLNEISNEQIAFFALEIELWRISDSPPAPKFNIVCSPNEWVKTVKESSVNNETSETRLLQGEFWEALKDYFEENGIFLKLSKSHFRNYYGIVPGRTGFSLNLTLNTNTNKLCCEIYVNGRNAKTAFFLLEKEKEDIESSMQTDLSWKNDLPGGSACRIAMYRDGDINERDNWAEYFRWFKEYAEKFHKAFSKRIQNLSFEES